MKTSITAVLTGKVKKFGPKGQLSGFRKILTDKNVRVTRLGIEGDEQADLKHHGGVDKAVLHYAHDHYSVWKRQKPELDEHLRQPGAFGENISTIGLTEDDVCIGDRYKLGGATVEVSQGRQPCWKLGHRFNDAGMVREVVDTGRCGWYYRVLEEGDIAVNDSIELLSRTNPQWSVARVFSLLISGEKDLDAFRELSELQPLSEHWRARAKKLYSNTLK